MSNYDARFEIRRSAVNQRSEYSVAPPTDSLARPIPENEFAHLDRAVRWLDDLVPIPFLNIRIGLDPILGLVPWAGDTAAALFSFYVIGTALHYRVPKIIILRMALNVAFDYLLGLVPFLGDAADFFVKSNRWNLHLLRRYARERGKPRFTDYLFVLLVLGTLVAFIIGLMALSYWLLSNLIKLRG